MGGLIGLTTTLGHIPSGPNLSDTRIQANMYLFFQDTAGNVSEAYPGCIHIRYVSDTDTPPPRSIRVTEVAAHLVLLQQVHHFVSSLTTKTTFGWVDYCFGMYPIWPKSIGYAHPSKYVSIFSEYGYKHIRDVSGAYPYPIRIGYGYATS